MCISHISLFCVYVCVCARYQILFTLQSYLMSFSSVDILSVSTSNSLCLNQAIHHVYIGYSILHAVFLTINVQGKFLV